MYVVCVYCFSNLISMGIGYLSGSGRSRSHTISGWRCRTRFHVVRDLSAVYESNQSIIPKYHYKCTDESWINTSLIYTPLCNTLIVWLRIFCQKWIKIFFRHGHWFDRGNNYWLNFLNILLRMYLQWRCVKIWYTND